jgi:hypothetical protein
MAIEPNVLGLESQLPLLTLGKLFNGLCLQIPHVEGRMQENIFVSTQ